MVFIKEKPFFRFPWAVHLKSIFQFANLQAKDEHRINLSDPVILRKWDFSKRLFFIPPKKKQHDGSCTVGVNRKVYSILHCRRAVHIIIPGSNPKPGNRSLCKRLPFRTSPSSVIELYCI